MRTMGVEEEYLLIGPDGSPTALAPAAIRAAERLAEPTGDRSGHELDAEFTQQQIETSTEPCTDLAELGKEIRLGRVRAQLAAEQVGARIGAIATSPMPVSSTITPDPRYREMTRQFAMTAREQLTCGCHVHVGVADDDEGVAVLDRIAPWLAPLLALSANSPFWQGEDSGYASFRAQVWNRWPTAGPVAPFGSAQAYHRVVADLVDSGAIFDTGMIYFDARLSARYPTVEIRIADVCLDADDAALLGALARGLVETAAREAADGVPAAQTRVEQLRAASWRAARSGLDDELISPRSFRPVPARRAVAELVDHVSAALADSGDLDRVTGLLDGLWARGNGASVQRRWLRETGDLTQVTERSVAATLT